MHSDFYVFADFLCYNNMIEMCGIWDQNALPYLKLAVIKKNCLEKLTKCTYNLIKWSVWDWFEFGHRAHFNDSVDY